MAPVTRPPAERLALTRVIAGLAVTVLTVAEGDVCVLCGDCSVISGTVGVETGAPEPSPSHTIRHAYCTHCQSEQP